jgi:hypothetical protein
VTNVKVNTRFRGGLLTIWTADQKQIIGETTDADWVEESGDGGINYVFSGTASDGTLDTLLGLIQAGVASVTYEFTAEGRRFMGEAMLLRPTATRSGAGATVTIETPDAPSELSRVGPSGAWVL